MMSENSLDCRICAIASGHAQSALEDQRWLSDSKYAAFGSIGGLLPGWSLVATRRHVLNLAHDYVRPDFWSFVSHAVSIVEEAYGPCVLFEHGSQMSESATSCGTSHAHLHIVPFASSLIEKAKAFDTSLDWTSVQADQIAQTAGESEYLFVADSFDGAKTSGQLAILREGTSQFFRRVIAHNIGRADEYDYRKFPQLEMTRETVRQLLSQAHKLAAA